MTRARTNNHARTIVIGATCLIAVGAIVLTRGAPELVPADVPPAPTEVLAAPEEHLEDKYLAATDAAPAPPRLEVFDLVEELFPPELNESYVLSESGEYVTYTVTITNNHTETWWHPITLDLTDVLDDAVFVLDEQGNAFEIVTWIDPAYSEAGSAATTVRHCTPAELAADDGCFTLAKTVPAGAHITVIYTMMLNHDLTGNHDLHDHISEVEADSSLLDMEGIDFEIDNHIMVDE